MKKTLIIAGILWLILLLVQSPVLSESKQNLKTLVPRLAETAPKIDGVLDDAVWQSGPIVDDIFITYNPIDGDVLPQKTTVYMAYDPDNLYFAFYCYDTDPDKIKTSVTKHDNVWSDDWVGFSLDTCASRQFSYEFFLNPYGIQGDIYNSSSTGEDSSPDYVWESAGKIVEDGYIVEVKIPLANFRFNSGENAEMYILFWRRINRMGISGSWPEIVPGESILGCASKVIYGNLNKQLMLEFIPSVTYSTQWNRETPDKWSDPDDNTEVGITGKYGVTSTITAEFTINPDYSQVESDAFSVLVNQRYPTFYSEKRPFFMEAGNLFDLAGTNRGDTNMTRVVHTRTIVDPAYGFRLSGEVGNLAFALLTTGDEAPGRTMIDDELNPFADKMAYFTAGRVKYNIGRSNYVGAIFTNNDFAEGYNQVFGADFKFRLSGHVLQGYFIQSSSKDKETLNETDGAAYSLQWDYSSRALGLCFWWEHLDTDFDMDSAFYSRSKMDKFTAYIGPSIFPKGEGWSWIHSINPFVWGQYTHDLETGEDDYFYIAVLRMYFIKDAWWRLDFRTFSEYWAGERLKGSYFYTQGEIQLTNWLYLYSYLRVGDGAYYDSIYPQVGNKLEFYLTTQIQPSGNFTQYFNYTYSKMDSKEDDLTLYDINILRSKTTYQFSDKLFLRAYIQYDDYRKILLGDVLLSYQLVPGTVLHLGYGSYHEKRSWQNDSWQEATNIIGDYYQTSQSIFFKASYLVQF